LKLLHSRNDKDGIAKTLRSLEQMISVSDYQLTVGQAIEAEKRKKKEE
jgi:hypothetical protein